MTSLLVIALIAVGVVLYQTQRELSRIRERLDVLEGRAFGAVPETPVAAVEPEPEYRVAAKVTGKRTASVIRAPVAPPDIPLPEEAEASTPRFAELSFENLVGGKLPIWVGGISLVFAGFFLVRYTIEAGLFGPGARSITATIFALAMIAMSELGGRLPKIGASFTADPRVGQSLAGAGVATLYGTLYMAAEIYGLIGVPTAFLLVVVVTAIAFALSLRHGPPTALMGLVGGFAAPWVAGMGASNLPTLLLYLAVFIAALFGLAVWRRWLWLLVLASGGGLLWSLAMLFTANGSLGLLGAFIAVLGGGAILAAKRFGEKSGIWAQLASYSPMTLAFAQLAILLPNMDFSATAWLLYFALSALSVVLAWHNRSLIPLVAGALVISLLPFSGAWDDQENSSATLAAAIGFLMLFVGAGQLRGVKRADDGDLWALIGIAAPVLYWFVWAYNNAALLQPVFWGIFAALAALPPAVVAWQRNRRSENSNTVQASATFATGLMAAIALIYWTDDNWHGAIVAAVALCVAAWAKRIESFAVRRLATLPLGIAIAGTVLHSHQLIESVGASLLGERAFYNWLPGIADSVSATFTPALVILAITLQRWFATGRRTRMAAFAAGGAGVAAFIWLLAKQPAAISTPADFIRLGFAERAVFTQALFGFGWLTLTQTQKRNWPSLATFGWVLAGVALFRVIWFDLLLLNPVMVPQSVGPVPVANLATGPVALTALWLWLMSKEAPPRFVPALQGLSLGAMIVTVLVTIRQAVQGNLISGASIETGENYLYSAGLLALAIGWLVLGINRGSKILRVAGLSLLTMVTFKAFLIDAAVITGILRILSFLGLGIALIGIGWAYGRLMAVDKTAKAV